jgi:hypothetical protein
VIGARLGHDGEIGAEESGTQFRDLSLTVTLFSGALAFAENLPRSASSQPQGWEAERDFGSGVG